MAGSEKSAFKEDDKNQNSVAKCNDYVKEIQKNFNYIHSDPSIDKEDKKYWMEFCYNILTLRNKINGSAEDIAIDENFKEYFHPVSYVSENGHYRVTDQRQPAKLTLNQENEERFSTTTGNLENEEVDQYVKDKNSCAGKDWTESTGIDKPNIIAKSSNSKDRRKHKNNFTCNETYVYECINDNTGEKLKEYGLGGIADSKVFPSSSELPVKEAVTLDLIWESESLAKEIEENVQDNYSRSLFSTSEVFDEKILKELKCKMNLEPTYYQSGYSSDALNIDLPYADKCNQAFHILDQIRSSIETQDTTKCEEPEKIERCAKGKLKKLPSLKFAPSTIQKTTPWCCCSEPKDPREQSPRLFLYYPSERSLPKIPDSPKNASPVPSESEIQSIRSCFDLASSNRNHGSPVLIYKKEKPNDFGCCQALAGVPVFPVNRNFMDFSKFTPSYKMKEEYYENSNISSSLDFNKPSINRFNEYQPKPYTEPESYFVNPERLSLKDCYSNSVPSRTLSISTFMTENSLRNRQSLLLETDLLENIYRSISFKFKTGHYSKNYDNFTEMLDFATRCIDGNAEDLFEEREIILENDSLSILCNLRSEPEEEYLETKAKIEIDDMKESKNTVVELCSSPIVLLCPQHEAEIETMRKTQQGGRILISEKHVKLPDNRNTKQHHSKHHSRKQPKNKSKPPEYPKHNNQKRTNNCITNHRQIPLCPVHSEITAKMNATPFQDVKIKCHNGKFIIYRERKPLAKQKPLWKVITEKTLKIFTAVPLTALLPKNL